MQGHYTTSRLSLNTVTLADIEFITELVNTPEWIKFIGDRNVHSHQEATEYIQRIIDNRNINYWVITIKGTQVPIGIITFIKRDYLDHHDIGFALLARHTRLGYAYEAASAVLAEALKEHSTVVATTIKENNNSIQLLEKLGLKFERETVKENEAILLYSISAGN